MTPDQLKAIGRTLWGGIYSITSPSGKFYIGSAVEFDRRRKEHWRKLKAQKHHNFRLQAAWNKYGEQLIFKPIIVCEAKDLLLFEQRAIDILSPPYNISPTAGTSLGVKHPPEFGARIAIANAKRVITPETRAKISAINRGKIVRPETRQRIGDAHRGKKLTEDLKKRLSLARMGMSPSPETREKLRLAALGRRHTPADLEKMRAANLGKILSAETKAKLSASRKALFAQRRAKNDSPAT